MISGTASAYSERILKAGLLLNKGDENLYSWFITQESNFFIQDIFSLGYETQFSYHSFSEPDAVSPRQVFSLNIFFNSKVKFLKRGKFIPYAALGVGLISHTTKYPDRFGYENYEGIHFMAGSHFENFSTAFQIEFRVLMVNRENSPAKFIILVGYLF